MKTGNIFSVGVGDTLFKYVYSSDFFSKAKQYLVKLPPGNTYISIFGPNQDKELECLEKSKYYKIIFKAPKAVNCDKDHGTEPRNTLVVYEVNDEQSNRV